MGVLGWVRAVRFGVLFVGTYARAFARASVPQLARHAESDRATLEGSEVLDFGKRERTRKTEPRDERADRDGR